MSTECVEVVPISLSSHFSRNHAVPRRTSSPGFIPFGFARLRNRACKNSYRRVHNIPREFRTASFIFPSLRLYRGIAAIMLIDSTSLSHPPSLLSSPVPSECAARNIFLMDGASHFVIIFAWATARNGAKLSAAIGMKLERESPAVDLFPRQDAKFIIRPRALCPAIIF